MKKLRMDLDALSVETFVADKAGGIGTVVGNSGTIAPTYPCSEIDACPSAPATC